MTPIELMDRLERLLNDLSSATEEYEQYCFEKEQKEQAFDIKYHQELIKAKTSKDKITAKEAESIAILAAEKEKFELQIAKVKEKVAKEKLNNIRIEIDTVRSMLSYLKSEYERTE